MFSVVWCRTLVASELGEFDVAQIAAVCCPERKALRSRKSPGKPLGPAIRFLAAAYAHTAPATIDVDYWLALLKRDAAVLQVQSSTLKIS